MERYDKGLNRNDVVYWRGKSYRCIEDTLINYTISRVYGNTNNYSHFGQQFIKEVTDLQIIEDIGHYYLQVTITLRLGTIGDNTKEAKW